MNGGLATNQHQGRTCHLLSVTLLDCMVGSSLFLGLLFNVFVIHTKMIEEKRLSKNGLSFAHRLFVIFTQ